MQGQVPSLDELAADPGKAASLTPEAARMVMVQCAGVLAALGCIAWTASGPEPVAPSEPERERLLTVADVAARLAIPKAYAYELVRRRTLPAIRVGARYIRVPEGALAEWVAKGLEMRSIPVVHIARERRRTGPAAQATRALAGEARRASRGGAQHGGSVGAGRASNFGTRRPARAHAGGNDASGPREA